jgi:hypothetical protein
MAARHEPPLSATEFKLIRSDRPGTSLSSRRGLAIARLPRTKRAAESFVCIVKRTEGDESRASITVPDRKFAVEPNYETPMRVCCAGPSGSGKSTFAANLIKRFVSEFDDPIYLISSVPQDDVLDKLGVIRIDADELADDAEENGPLDIAESFGESVVITDDIDTLADAPRKAALALRDNLLECGRHYGVNLQVHLTHTQFDGKATKRLNGESNAFAVFPRSESYSATRLLEKYLGASPADAKRILKIPTRVLYLSREYPRFLVSEHTCELF